MDERPKFSNIFFNCGCRKKNTEKDKDVKVAEEIFKVMGINKDNLCHHGLPFFQCMSCSH